MGLKSNQAIKTPKEKKLASHGVRAYGKSLGEALTEAMQGQHAPGSWENSSEQNKFLRSLGWTQSSGGTENNQT